MASKHKRGAGQARAADGTTPRQEVDRLIAKGWFKDAVKQAKICHRDHPSPEHHRLLEKAYLLRAQDLRDGGMPMAAREVASHLLDFGLTDPELTEPVATLLLSVGMAGEALALQGRLDSPEAVERLGRQAADQAVLHPERATAAPPEIVEGAKRVRLALEALVAGDEAKALEGLRDVARSSPFADWRLFARGLAASRRGDDAEARANWDRLDPDRAASRIARALLAATEDAAPGEGPAALAKREKLERWAFGESLLGPLRELGEAAAQGLWTDALRKLGPARLALRRFDPALAARVTRALMSPLMGEAMDLGYREAQALLKQFTKAAEPLPIDPRWNRLWAQVWEGPQGHIAQAEPFWRKYLDDLESVPAIRPEERDRARALVLTHIGEKFADAAVDDDQDGPDFRRVDPEVERDRRRAVACLEESLKLLPSHRATYQTLMDVFDDADQPDRAMEVARRLLQALPDDFDALISLSDHHFDRDEPGQALEFTLRARKLRPLDRKTIEDEWACRVALARQHALHGRWDEGRSELVAAERLNPDQALKPHFAARKATLELKASRPEVAAEIVAGALGRLAEPAPLWLGMAIEARRFQLPKAEIGRAEARWTGELAKKVRGETAGALGELLGAFLVGEIDYPGRAEHVRQVADYLRRTTRIKYTREDLTHACGFLSLVPKERELFEKMAKRGLKLFPDAPQFPLMLGSLEMEKGPYRADLKLARRHLDAALKLALPLEATDPTAAAIIPQVKEVLSALNELTEGPMGPPFAFPFSSPGPDPFGPGKTSPREMLDAIARMMESGVGDDDFFDPLDDDDDDDLPAPAPQPRPKGRKRKPL